MERRIIITDKLIKEYTGLTVQEFNKVLKILQDSHIDSHQNNYKLSLRAYSYPYV